MCKAGFASTLDGSSRADRREDRHEREGKRNQATEVRDVTVESLGRIRTSDQDAQSPSTSSVDRASPCRSRIC